MKELIELSSPFSACSLLQDEDDAEMRLLWGNLVLSMFTLFTVLTLEGESGVLSSSEGCVGACNCSRHVVFSETSYHL